jgi:hypothetical protein
MEGPGFKPQQIPSKKENLKKKFHKEKPWKIERRK